MKSAINPLLPRLHFGLPLRGTRSIALQLSAVNPLLPRLHFGLPLRGQRPPANLG